MRRCRQLQVKLDKLVAEKSRNVNTLELLEKYHAKYQGGRAVPHVPQRHSKGMEGRSSRRSMVDTSSPQFRELVIAGDRLEKKATAVRKRIKRMTDLSPLFHDYVRLNVKERGHIQAKLDSVQREVAEAEGKALSRRRWQ